VDDNTVLVITAHPDDVDFGAAGTIASWVSAGAAVTYCVVTDGDAGGFDPNVARREMRTIRRAEQRSAAGHVGVTDVIFLGYPDGRLTASIELRRDLSRVIRKVRPSRVLCQSPERNYSRIFASHPDHLAAGEAALCAVYPDARNPFAHPELLAEGLQAHSVGEVWMMGSEHPDTFVDITDTFDAKLAALRAHVSQRTDHDGKLEARLRSWAADHANALGRPPGTLVEGFRRIATT
jgi:LmbE family N-acetylglucosaminyl deacetylase